MHRRPLRREGPAGIQALGGQVDRLFDSRLNIAVNCAGINMRNPIERVTLSEWESVQRVNSTGAFLSPGPFLTEMTRPLVNDQDTYRQLCANIPIGRFGEPHEIVTACLFLASPASTYVTGAEIAVDGGWMAT